ncbi:MAG: PIN domain-containing protein [Candidatus Saccharimonadales bacterium]
MKPIKVVFDSNVYLAALKPDSYAHIQLKRSQPNGPYQLFLSPEILLEIRDKLEVKFGFSVVESAKFIDMVMLYVKLVQPTQRIAKVLECAMAAKAELIITADRGLLKLKEYNGTKIAHPSMLKYWFPQ